jgi:hypothetical protein
MDEDKRIPLRLWILLPIWAMGIVGGTLIIVAGMAQALWSLFAPM